MIEKFPLVKSFFREIDCELTKYFEFLTIILKKFGYDLEF